MREQAAAVPVIPVRPAVVAVIDDDDDDDEEDALAAAERHMNEKLQQKQQEEDLRRQQALAEAEKNKIQLVLRTKDSTTAKYRINKTDPLQKLLDAFCAKTSTDISRVRLMFDGDILPPNSSAEDHDLEDDDVLDVLIR